MVIGEVEVAGGGEKDVRVGSRGSTPQRGKSDPIHAPEEFSTNNEYTGRRYDVCALLVVYKTYTSSSLHLASIVFFICVIVCFSVIKE